MLRDWIEQAAAAHGDDVYLADARGTATLSYAELLELVRISVPVGMGPLGIAMPFVMQHVLIKAVVRFDVRYVEMMRVVPFLVAGVPMRDFVFVVQVPGALILMRRSVRVLASN